MNMNFSDDLSLLRVNYARGSWGQWSSPTALTRAARRSQVECQKVWKVFIHHRVSGADNGMSNNPFARRCRVFATQLKLMSLCALLSVQIKGWEDWCTPVLFVSVPHACMIILPIKSRAGQQSSRRRFLNESLFCLAESLMPELLLSSWWNESDIVQRIEVLLLY